jgi:hypothetical protein
MSKLAVLALYALLVACTPPYEPDPSTVGTLHCVVLNNPLLMACGVLSDPHIHVKEKTND